MPTSSIPLRAAIAAIGLGLAGCTGLETLTRATEPVELYDLTPKSTHSEDLPTISAQIVVDVPTAAASVNTDRIAVKPDAYTVEYLPVARWVDRAPLLVQTLLLESFENSERVRSVGRLAIGLSSDFTLVSELREFQAITTGEDPSLPLRVLVQLNVKIVKEPQGLIIASRTFAYNSTSSTTETLSVIAAFDEALGKVMGQAVDWSLREIAANGG